MSLYKWDQSLDASVDHRIYYVFRGTFNNAKYLDSIHTRLSSMILNLPPKTTAIYLYDTLKVHHIVSVKDKLAK